MPLRGKGWLGLRQSSSLVATAKEQASRCREDLRPKAALPCVVSCHAEVKQRILGSDGDEQLEAQAPQPRTGPAVKMGPAAILRP